MGASVRPVSIDDDLKAIRAKSQPRSINDDLAKIRGDTGDIVLPENKEPAKPGLLQRAGKAIAETAKDLYHHPSHIVTEPINAGFDALVTPVQGSESSGIGGRGGKASLPTGTKVTTENTPGAITPERQLQAGVETIANVAAPGAAGKFGRLIAPKVGEVAGEVLGRVGANAGAGAATNPSDPIVGAATGITAGEALHHTVERTVKAAVPSEAPKLRIERRSTPTENRPVWTQEERDAYHAQQVASHEQGLKDWKQGQPVPQLASPTHPDVMAEQFQRGKTEPFPYQKADDLAEKAVTAPRRKAQANAVDPKYRLETDADLLSRAGELSGRLEEYSSGEHGGPLFVRDNLPATGRSDTSPTGGRTQGDYLEHPVSGGTRVASRMTQDRDLYNRAITELKARGWKDSDISDAVDERAGMQYRHSGPGLVPEAAKGVRNVLNSALYSPAAAIRESHPDLTAAGEAALSAPANARHIGTVQTKWVTEGVDPKLAESFLPQLQLDRLNHLLSKDPSLAHDPAFVSNLNDLQKRVPQGFNDTPEFKQMVDRYKSGILNQTEHAAASAGLKPEQFADLPNAYARLVPSETAPEGTFADDVGGTGPKKLAATRLTTAQSATGTGAYTNSLVETVTRDALEKVVKGRQNEFYQELVKAGTPIERDAQVPEGMSKIMFDDKANVIDDPAQAKITLAVPKDVALYAKHVYAELHRPGATTPAGVAAKAMSHASGGLALLANPAAASSHSLTLANTVGSVPDVGRPLNNLVGILPGGATAKGAFDIATVDRTEPGTRALESRLSRIGALRPEMEHPTEGIGHELEKMRKALGPVGKVLSPHEILFGEDGIDKRSRLVLAQKYIQASEKRNIPVTDSGLREFVTQHAGDYIRGNAGALVNHLQDSNLSLFARMGITRLTNSAKTAVGKSGLPSVTTAQRLGDVAGTMTRGLVGYGVGLTALNYLMSGHSTLSNEPGHMADLEYKTDDKGNKHYIRGGILNPLASTAMRSGGESLVRGDARGVVKDATNAALGVATSHPALRGAIEATTGRQPYIERDGSMLRTVPPELKGTDAVAGRLKSAVRDMTAAGQMLGSGPEKNPGVPGGKALSYLMPPITSVARPGGEARATGMDTQDWLDDRTSQVKRAAGNKEKQDSIIKQAIEDVESFNKSNAGEQVTKGMVEKQLRHAQAKSNSGVQKPGRLVRPQPTAR